MEFNEYQKATAETAIYDDKYAVIYPLLGLANEAGEVLGKFKKILRDEDGDISKTARQNLLSELGDVCWYVARVAADLDATFEEVIQGNLDKLFDRKERGVLGGSGDNR